MKKTTSCLIYLPAGRMKLKSSGVRGRRIVSCLVIDRFGPAPWKLHGRGKRTAKAARIITGENWMFV